MKKHEKCTKRRFERIINFHKAVGDTTRIQLLWALNKGEMCVQELADCIGLSKSAVSHQLKELKIAKLVKNRKQGKYSYYSLHEENIEYALKQTHEVLVK